MDSHILHEMIDSCDFISDIDYIGKELTDRRDLWLLSIPEWSDDLKSELDFSCQAVRIESNKLYLLIRGRHRHELVSKFNDQFDANDPITVIIYHHDAYRTPLGHVQCHVKVDEIISNPGELSVIVMNILNFTSYLPLDTNNPKS